MADVFGIVDDMAYAAALRICHAARPGMMLHLAVVPNGWMSVRLWDDGRWAWRGDSPDFDSISEHQVVRMHAAHLRRDPACSANCHAELEG